MSTTQDVEKSNCRLGQYYQNFFHSRGGYARQIFRKDANIDYTVSTTKYLELHHSELIGCTALHIAAQNNCSSDIEYLLSRGVDPMIKNQNGLTALHFAVKDSYFETIDDFHKIKSYCASMLSAQVRSGNLENLTDNNGLSHFHIACIADHAEAIKFFINSGVSVDETVNMDSPYVPGYTPLHLAAKYCALEAIKLLLKYEANTQLKNAEGMTFLCKILQFRFKIVRPLSNCSACFRGLEAANLKVMNFIFQNAGHTIENSGLTLFNVACLMGDLSIVEGLLHKISDINKALDMDALHWPGYTALHFAAYSSIDMVKMLMKNGANLLAKDAKGVTPLDMCIENYGLEDVHAVLSLDDSWRSILMSDRKTRLLHLIDAMKDTNVFKYFLETRGKLVNTYVPSDAPAWQGFTPLHLAVIFYDYRTPGEEKDERSADIIKKLLAKGANINAQDARRWSPIHLAFRQDVRYTKKNATKLLLEFHDKIEDAIDEDNLSHLHIACEMDHKQSVEKILRTNVDINVAIKDQVNVPGMSVGSTPLHCAATNDDIVNLLMARGADPLLKNKKNMTAIHLSDGRSQNILSSEHLTDSIVDNLSHLHIAVKSGNLAAVNKLLDNGADIHQALLRKYVWYKGFETPLDLAVIKQSLLRKNVSYKRLDTALDVAVEKDNEKMIELVLRRGANILVKEPAIPTQNASYILKQFVSTIDGDDDLFKRLEKEIGLTMFHVACYKKDVDLVKALLESGADVNARIDVRSRLWPGYTPLHCTSDDDYRDKKIDAVVGLLIRNGADICLTTGFPEQETALHMIFARIPRGLHHEYSCMKMILRDHRGFTVNPTRIDGMSHLYMACNLGDVESVEQFLKHDVDVNQRIDFFKIRYEWCIHEAGYTPLLLVANYTHDRDPLGLTQLNLIDLLLNHGADVDAENEDGDTALHLMADLICQREGDILRLIKNIHDETPPERLMSTREAITIDKINCFLKYGCHFNLFNCTTDEGLIAKALTLIPHEDQLFDLIGNWMIKFPQLMQIEETGRTVIHNIVSNTNELVNDKRISATQYIALIDKLFKFDLHVDDQDKLGRTPLHLAALFRNIEAIEGLLRAGADVNITDASGNTAFSYLFQPCTRCSETRKRLENHNQYDHFDIISIFVGHLQKLLLCELTVNQINETLLLKAFREFSTKNMAAPKLFESQINSIKGLKIAKSELTLERFLSETDAIVAYPTLPQADRDAINHFFRKTILVTCVPNSEKR